jgi:hypothetical protein
MVLAGTVGLKPYMAVPVETAVPVVVGALLVKTLAVLIEQEFLAVLV